MSAIPGPYPETLRSDEPSLAESLRRVSEKTREKLDVAERAQRELEQLEDEENKLRKDIVERVKSAYPRDDFVVLKTEEEGTVVVVRGDKITLESARRV